MAAAGCDELPSKSGKGLGQQHRFTAEPQSHFVVVARGEP